MDSDQSASDLFCIKGDLQEAGGEKRGKHIFRKGKKAEIERRAGSRIMMQLRYLTCSSSKAASSSPAVQFPL